MTDADEKVERLILRKWRNHADTRRRPLHLHRCPDVYVDDSEASDGLYACDTGCEYARFEAIIRCPHGESEEFEWGDFGRIHDFIDEMDDDRPIPGPPQPMPVLRADDVTAPKFAVIIDSTGAIVSPQVPIADGDATVTIPITTSPANPVRGAIYRSDDGRLLVDTGSGVPLVMMAGSTMTLPCEFAVVTAS